MCFLLVIVANAAGSVTILSLSDVQGKSAKRGIRVRSPHAPKTLAMTAPLAKDRQSIQS